MKQLFKLVPTDSVKPGEPHVAVVSGETTTFPGTTPQWARHITEGSAAIYNVDKLIQSQPEERYARLVKQVKEVCKFLKWNVTFEQDVDGILFIIIDDCPYFIAPETDDKSFYLAVMVHHAGSRYEPPSEDESPLLGKLRLPEHCVSRLVDAHMGQIKQWALECTMGPDSDEESI